MSESITILQTPDADRRLLMKLQHRLLQTPPPKESISQAEDERLPLLFALAPMALAFFYLIVLSVILFR